MTEQGAPPTGPAFGRARRAAYVPRYLVARACGCSVRDIRLAEEGRAPLPAAASAAVDAERRRRLLKQ